MVRVHHHHRRIPQPKVVELIQDLTGGVIGPRDGCVIMPAELLQLDVGACSVRVVHKVFAAGVARLPIRGGGRIHREH